MGSLIAVEGRSTEAVGLLVVLVVAALLATALLGVNARRIKRREPLRNPPAAMTAIVFLLASLLLFIVAIDPAIPWAMAMSGVSFLGTWTYLLTMLARRAPRKTNDETVDFGARKSGRPPRNGASWLEISAQIAGILSLVVSVIALLND